MRIDLHTAAQTLRGMDDILLLTHRNPDGDALGSLWALGAALRKMGKTVSFHLSGRVPSNLAFLAEEPLDDSFRAGFVVAVDLAESSLLGDELAALYADKIDLNIDHHRSNKLFAAQTLLDEEASATAELIWALYKELGVALDKKSAEQLYVGISTDTGCFRYNNTTAKCLFVAAALVEAGADNGEINRLVFETKTKAYILFETMALNSMRTYFDGKCAVITLTGEMFKRTGLDDSDIHMISALPRQMEGVVAGVTIKEKSGGLYRVSLRTNEPVDASEICAVFGGGGHKLAAGCDLNGNLRTVTAMLLKQIEAAFRAHHLL